MNASNRIFLPLESDEAVAWQRFLNQIKLASKTLLLCESNVIQHAQFIQKSLFEETKMIELLSQGEGFKSFQNLEMVLGILYQERLDRNSLLIVVGGGAFSDLCGLAASLYHRGMAWIVVPTSLLSMVDASIGGKTAINLGETKNLVGAFHEPVNLILYPESLKTLSQIEFNSGFGEMLKTVLLISAREFSLLESINPNQVSKDSPEILKLIDVCMKFKQKIVKADPEETKNLRYMLNLGHTIGHALESEFFYQVPHGICVAYGVWLEACLASKLHGIAPLLVAKIARVINTINYKLPFKPDAISVLNRCLGDKKNYRDTVGFVFLRDAGELRDGFHTVTRYGLDELKTPMQETFFECFA